MSVKGGATNVTRYFMVRLVADGTAATGLTPATFDMQYTRNGAAPAAKADGSALSTTADAHSDNGIIEVDATDSPGLYRTDWPDAAFAAGVDDVMLLLTYDATVFAEALRVDIDPPVNVVAVSADQTAADNLELACANYSATRGLTGTALPAAAADAIGGLPISDAGGLDLDAKLANTNEITVARMGALTDWIDGGRLDVLLDAIPTTAMRGTDSAATEVKQDIIDTNVVTLLLTTDRIKKVVWFDSVNGASGTDVDINGRQDNPSDTIANVLTMAVALGTNIIRVVEGSTLTLDAATEGYRIIGKNWTLALGSQSISGSYIEGATVGVSGICTGAIRPVFKDCTLGTLTAPPCGFYECGLDSGQVTAGSAGVFVFDNCHSRIAGVNFPLFNASDEIVDLSVRHYSGGFGLSNFTDATSDVSIEANGNVSEAVTCTAGTLVIRGNATLTTAGSMTVSDNARIDIDQINQQADLALNDYDGPTRVEATTDKDAIITQGDSAWVTATGFNTTTPPTVAAIADGVWDELTAGHLVAGSFGVAVSDILVDTNGLHDGAIPEITGASDVPATPTLVQAVMLNYMDLRNDSQNTATERRVLNSAGTEVLDATMSDDTTTFSPGKLGDA